VEMPDRDKQTDRLHAQQIQKNELVMDSRED
jgi:hypothetical protein